MIGLHHQMSYSPAAAAAAAGTPTRNSEAPTKRRPSQQKQPMRQHYFDEHSMRHQSQMFGQLEPLEQHNQLHQLQEASRATGAAGGAPKSSGGRAMVRVAARTAQQIVVESLPACGREPKSQSRARRRQAAGAPSDELSGSQAVAEVLRRGQSSSSSSYEEQAGATTNQPDERVLLIMSDAGSKSAGVPVIGRRLPSKSFGPSPTRSHDARPLLVRELPGAVTQAIFRPQQQQQHQQQQPAPVVGRRSHRMLSQQLEPAAPVGQDQVPIGYQQQAAAGSRMKCPSLSVLSSYEQSIGLAPEQRRPASSSSKRLLAKSRRKSAPKIERRASNSCSSLCSPDWPLAPTGAPSEPNVCFGACCQPAISSGPSATSMELLRCETNNNNNNTNYYNATDQQQRQKHLSVATDLPDGCMLACCYGGRPTRRQQVRGSSHPPDAHYSAPHDYHAINSSVRRGSLHCHDSCQANDSSFGRQLQHHTSQTPQRHKQLAPPVPSKPTRVVAARHGRPLVPVMFQAEPADTSKVDEDEHVTQMYESLAAELKAKLGNPNRAPILLPPKDYDTLSRQQGKLTGIELRRSTNPQLVGPAPGVCRSSSSSSAAAAAAVPAPGATCANPNSSSSARTKRGPFVASARISEGSVSPASGATEASPSLSPASGATDCGGPSSSRSSGRGSQTNGSNGEPESRVDSLQRSRSSSSSGLGSISLAARSPDSSEARSSPSSKSASGSSSEEMRQLEQKAATDEGHAQDDVRRGTGIENHNPSKVANGILWNGRVEIPLKVNSARRDGNTYLATKQIIY